MIFKVLTYNLLFGTAIGHAQDLIDEHNPDVVCVQELPTEEKYLKKLVKGDMSLASWSNSFMKFWNIYGNAVYINKKTCEVVSERQDEMPASMYDFWVYLTKGITISRRFTETHIRIKGTDIEFYLYNAHLTHFSFADLRLAQLRTVFDCVKERGEKARILITGDFNLYNGKTELEQMMALHNVKEATTAFAYTFQHPLFFFMVKMKLDYILYRGFELLKTTRFELKKSDHHALMSEFEV